MPETSTRTLARAGTAAAVIVAVACGLDFASGRWEAAAIEARIAEIKKPADEQKKLTKELSTLQKRIAELEPEVQEAETLHAELGLITRRSERFSALLEFIAGGRNDDLVVDEIAVAPTGLQLIGRAIRSDAATSLAMHLSPRVEEMGWKVKAPAMRGKNQLVNGGPWEFTIDLVDIVPKAEVKSDPTAPESGTDEVQQDAHLTFFQGEGT